MDAYDVHSEVFGELERRDAKFDELQQTVWELQKENEAKAKCLEILTEHLDKLIREKDIIMRWIEEHNDDFRSLQGGVMYLLKKESQEAVDAYFQGGKKKHQE